MNSRQKLFVAIIATFAIAYITSMVAAVYIIHSMDVEIQQLKNRATDTTIFSTETYTK